MFSSHRHVPGDSEVESTSAVLHSHYSHSGAIMRGHHVLYLSNNPLGQTSSTKSTTASAARVSTRRTTCRNASEGQRGSASLGTAATRGGREDPRLHRQIAHARPLAALGTDSLGVPWEDGNVAQATIVVAA